MSKIITKWDFVGATNVDGGFIGFQGTFKAADIIRDCVEEVGLSDKKKASSLISKRLTEKADQKISCEIGNFRDKVSVRVYPAGTEYGTNAPGVIVYFRR